MAERVIVANRCAQCFEPADKKCSRCKTVQYCSLACQKKHWSVSHQLTCNKTPRAEIENTGAGLSLPTHWLFEPREVEKLFVDKVSNLTVGLVNTGNTCFANAVLQCLTSTKALQNYVKSQAHTSCALRASSKFCLMCLIERHVVTVARASEPVLPTVILQNLPQINKEFSHGNQEDSAEFLKSVLRGLHMSALRLRALEERKVISERTEHTTLVHQLFGGYLRSQLRCPECGHCNNTYEAFSDLSLEIHTEHTDSLEEMLESFTKTERLDTENRYKCDKCSKSTRAEKRITVHQPSNYLVVHLKRFRLGLFGKINKPIAFKLELSLAPFMSTPLEHNSYRLYAVIVHLDLFNISSFGHYICYIADKEDKNLWYRIDDAKVTPVSLKEVLQLKAYILFYERVLPFIASPEVAAPTDAPTGPSLCLAGCGFFGSPQTGNMCSQCFAREGSLEPVRKAKPRPAVTIPGPKQVPPSASPKRSRTPEPVHNVEPIPTQSVNAPPDLPSTTPTPAIAEPPSPLLSPEPATPPDASEAEPAVLHVSSPSSPQCTDSGPESTPEVPAIPEAEKPRKTNTVKGTTINKPSSDSQKIGRNDKCPCGSGRKYKQCHAK